MRGSNRSIHAAVAGFLLCVLTGIAAAAEPLERYPVTVAFHGHAHRGQLEGRTRVGTPVYNVALPLLRRHFGAEHALRIIDLPLPPVP